MAHTLQYMARTTVSTKREAPKKAAGFLLDRSAIVQTDSVWFARRNRRWLRSGASGLVVSLALSCDGSGTSAEFASLDGLAVALCDRQEECGCENAVEHDASCADELVLGLLPPDYERDALDLVYDPQCVDEIVIDMRSVACGDVALPRGADGCTPFYGPGRLGDECDVGQIVSTCQRGLACLGGRCTDSFEVAGPPAAGSPCPAQGCPAEQNLFCGAQGICEPFPLEEEPCEPSTGCAPGLVCGGSLTCQPGLDLGEGCSGHTQCASGYCPRGACEERPGEGEACGTQLLCALGLRCEGEVCVSGTQGLCDL